MLHYLRADYDQSPPTAADLRRLAEDPILDWIVLPYPVEGLCQVSDGHVFVFDCARLRRESGR